MIFFKQLEFPRSLVLLVFSALFGYFPVARADFTSAAGESFAAVLSSLPPSYDSALKYFLDPEQLQQLRSTGQSNFANKLSQNVAVSQLQPVPLYNKAKSGDGGIVIFQGSVFPEGYFRQHIGDPAFLNACGGVATVKLISRQPWFQWNGNSWIFKTSGAQEALLGHSSGSQQLYRGTTILEWALLRSYQLLAQNSLTEDQQKELGNALRALPKITDLGANFHSFLVNISSQTETLLQAKSEERVEFAEKIFNAYLQTLSTLRKDAIFLTPNQRIAQAWVKSALIKYTLSQEELRHLLATKAIYVGVEYEYVEVAVPVRESLLLYFSKAQLIPKSSYLPPEDL